MTPTMLRAMGKSLLEDVTLESNQWFASNKDVPEHIATGMLVLAGISKACFEAAEAGEREKVDPVAQDPDVLGDLEDICRQNCTSLKVDRDYNGQVAGTLVTDSGAISAHADGLRRLAKHSRFRIVADGGRMVVGYWPEHDPQKQTIGKETSHA